MAEELEEVFGIQATHVMCSGPPHFDAHHELWSVEYLRTVITELGLKPDQPFLFFGMSLPVYAPTEIDIVEWLAAKIHQGTFGDSMQLVVRTHPQFSRSFDPDSDLAVRIEALKSERVAVDQPALQESKLPGCMTDDDLRKLVQLVGGCATCLNSGSTLALDAIYRDRPVIMPHFDVGETRPWWDSVRRCGDFNHLRKLIDTGGVKIARSFDELAEAIGAYIQDPTLDRQGRAFCRELELGACDGRATIRAAEALGRTLAAVPIAARFRLTGQI